MTLKVLELFGGIGACTKALERLGVPHEVVDYVEIDKYAVKSFNAIHGTNFEPQDITNWDKDIECDLIMHGSPCQDFSLAGKQAGGDKGSGTRSSLMYETLRIVEKLQPKYVIWENVKNLISKKHFHNFDAYLEVMKNLGYVNYYQVLNAKDYGVPQNRERVFTISIRNDIKKDFFFPTPFPLERKLKDIIEDSVDEKYYLSPEKIEMISKWKCYEKPLQHIKEGDDILGTLTTRSGAECGGLKLIKIKGAYGRNYGSKGKLENLDKEIGTLQAAMGEGGGNVPLIPIKTANKLGYDLAQDGDGIDLSYPDSNTRRGRVGHGVSKTLATADYQGVLDGVRIRKLTPKECWRLMGFDDIDFEKAESVNSNSQLYKQAGNSIVVNVLEVILKGLLCKS